MQFLKNQAITAYMLYTQGNGTLTYTHTHPFNGPLYSTTRGSRYQKGKTNLHFTEARDNGIAGPYASLHLAPER